MKNRLFLFCLLAVMAVSCAKEQHEVIQTITDDPVFHATIENADTRVFADDQLRVLWNADDRVSIFNKSTYNWQYRFDGVDGDNAGAFKKIPTDDFITSNPLGYVYSVYPYNENTKITNDGEIIVYLPAEQTYRENSFGLGDNTMIAIAEDNELMFKNLCGYFAVKLYGDNVSVKSITLKGNNNELLAGKATVVASIDEDPALTFDATVASKMITLTPECPVRIGSTEETATTFWFVIPPTTFNSGITLSVTDQNNGSFVKATTGSLVISRNRLKNSAALKVETGSSPGGDKVYGRISDARFVTEGAQFVVATAADNLSWAMSATQGADFRSGVAVTKTNPGTKAGESVETIVGPSEEVEVLTVETGTSDGTYAFKTKAGKYLAIDKDKNAALVSIDTKSTLSDWRIRYSDGECEFRNNSTSYTYYLRYRKSDNKFVAMRSSFASGGEPIALYKLDGSGSSDWKLPPELRLTKQSMILTRGETKLLGVGLCYSLDDGGIVTYESKDPTIATVDAHGNVTAVELGQTTVIARVSETNNYQADSTTCIITVVDGDKNSPIQFEDPIAKFACVEKFDSNGDGELSFAEAAAVTSLEGLFTNWNTVTSFEELKYFTGITSTAGVFEGLASLTHITIPDQITTLGTFRNCTALDTVKLPATLASLPTYCFDRCLALKSVTLPTGITSIPNYAFRNCAALETLDVPSTITSVGQYAFSGCTALTGIDLPSGFKNIGDYAFNDCQALSALVFPVSMTSIGQSAFSGCMSLPSVTLGGSVSVGKNAFQSCHALTSVSMGSGVTLDQSVFSGCMKLVSVVLPEDLISIPDYCFQSCTALTTIAWPQSLTSIGNSAFEGCRFADAGYAVELPATVTSIGRTAFGHVHHLIVPSVSPVNIISNSFIPDYTFIYVPAGMVEMYKARTNWSNYADWIRPIGDYPVTMFTIGGAIGEAVDLGLSVKWASWNIGASAPEEYGAYFAWGETEIKWDYDWTHYKWCNGSNTSMIKYNTSSSYGTVDNKTTLDLEDDAAHVNWGGAWRVPTENEIQELINNCTSNWTTENGINGYRFTSKKLGYTDKSIFIPAAGFRGGYQLCYCGNRGYYWSSLLTTGAPQNVNHLFFNYNDVYVSYYDPNCHRADGFPIRPVCP